MTCRFNSSIISVEFVALTENTYEIVGDFTGGLWGDLYASAYGTSARSVSISDICNNISWDQEASDQFGGNIVYGDSPSYYDPATGNIMVSWTCTGYGETEFLLTHLKININEKFILHFLSALFISVLQVVSLTLEMSHSWRIVKLLLVHSFISYFCHC